MKEFINKLISRLEELKTYYAEDFSQGYSCEVDCVEKYEVKKIVNELAEEYINTSTDTSTDTSTTNADRIRSMTDEELAEFISKYFSCEYECAVRDKCGSDWDCKRATIAWLQSEVEGVAENE